MLLDQEIDLPESVEPFASRVVADATVDAPIVKLDEPRETDTDDTATVAGGCVVESPPPPHATESSSSPTKN